VLNDPRGTDAREQVSETYLGLDPKVRQSGAGPANHGHISLSAAGSSGTAGRTSTSSNRAGPASWPLSTEEGRAVGGCRRSCCRRLTRSGWRHS